MAESVTWASRAHCEQRAQVDGFTMGMDVEEEDVVVRDGLSHEDVHELNEEAELVESKE